MAQQFTSLNAVLRGGPLVDSQGRPSRDFLKWLQGIENKASAINLSAQVVGNISTSASVVGRTDGLGTTLANIDSSGIVTASGVDLSRNYVNKSLENIPDSSLRKALTVEQSNYVAVASVVTSGQNGTARPTTYDDLGTVATTDPRLAYDASDGTTYAVVSGGGPGASGRCSYRGFIQPTGTLSVATLHIETSLITIAADTDIHPHAAPRGIVRYSLDGGLSFVSVFSLTTDRAKTDDTVSLLVGQDFTKIWVEALVNPTTIDGDSGEVDVFDTYVSYTLA